MSIKSFIAALFAKAETVVEAVKPEPHWNRPVAFCDMPEDALRFIHDKGKCPYCKSEYGFYEGPRGGASVNIFCGNPDCNSRFNVGDPAWGFIPMGQFTGECPPEFIAQRRREIAAESRNTKPQSSMY